MCGKALAMMLALRESISLSTGEKPKQSLVFELETAAKSQFIPVDVGKGGHKSLAQKRTLIAWTTVAAAAIACFSIPSFGPSPGARAAALSLVFPGAGYIACANILGWSLLALTYLLLPVCLFAWFGAGGLAFPITLWLLSAVGAYFAAGETLNEWASVVSAVLLFAFFLMCNRQSAKARSSAAKKREARNEFLPEALENIEASSIAANVAAERELSLEELRRVQHLIDMSVKAIDDWTDFNVIDQFQTSALRYQLYEMMYCLSIYQGVYTPNFHSYLSASIRNTIEKSLTPKVLGFWKWETLWGKFKTDFEPVDKDNIMVTGWLLQGLMLYQSNTQDTRYTVPGSLKFKVTERNIYTHDIHSISRALVRQWTEDPYTLFSCEPNWIYTPCNMYGMTGQFIYDRVFNKNHAQDILPAYEASLNTNFTEPDGSILPIRSQLTGFTIPGLCGALSDLVNALLCRGYLDHIARRMWALFRTECLDFNAKTGTLKLKGLVGADKIDPGNYKSNEFAILPHLAYVAGEYGDEPVRKAALKELFRGAGTEVTATGAFRLKKEHSNAMITGSVRASMLRKNDWVNLISKGPPAAALAGPILDNVQYPGVIVAKARSHTSKDLEVVLYPSADDGLFELGVARLRPGEEYVWDAGRFVADSEGKALLHVRVEGRTSVFISPYKSATV